MYRTCSCQLCAQLFLLLFQLPFQLPQWHHYHTQHRDDTTWRWYTTEQRVSSIQLFVYSINNALMRVKLGYSVLNVVIPQEFEFYLILLVLHFHASQPPECRRTSLVSLLTGHDSMTQSAGSWWYVRLRCLTVVQCWSDRTWLAWRGLCWCDWNSKRLSQQVATGGITTASGGFVGDKVLVPSFAHFAINNHNQSQWQWRIRTRVPTHPWKSLKVLEFFIVNLRPWKSLKTGQVLESPWIHQCKLCDISNFVKHVFCPKQDLLIIVMFCFYQLKLSHNHRNRY